jgi:hypothetical protein
MQEVGRQTVTGGAMTETVLGDRLFVGGEWVEASATGETFAW